MPTALIVLAHPTSSSFCHALAQTAIRVLADAGFTVITHDLYAERFPPVMDPDETQTTRTSGRGAFAVGRSDLVTTHRGELSAAAVLVVIHPNWWGKPPAIMAGWMDRVLAPGVVYQLDDRAGRPVPLLALQAMVVLNTGDTDPAREKAVFTDPLDSIWRRCVGTYLPTARIDRLLFGPLGGSTPAQRDDWLARSAAAVQAAVTPQQPRI